jgi:hypothetical protein
MIFSFAIGMASRNVCIGVLPKHQVALMGPCHVIGFNPSIEIGLQLRDGAINFLAEGDPVELVEHCLVEALEDAIGLRAPWRLRR